MPRVRVSITNLQSALPIDADTLRRAVHEAFRDSRERSVQINVAVVDDATIHDLNKRHLDHDYPTDVLSYPLEDTSQKLIGEVVVSAETAQREAPDFAWSSGAELCLYVVHGALHLAGYRDKTSAEKRAMRVAEQNVLSEIGIPLGESESSETQEESHPLKRAPQTHRPHAPQPSEKRRRAEQNGRRKTR